MINRQEEEAQPADIEQYKGQLKLKVAALFAVCVLVIVERIFFDLIVGAESEMIADLQAAWGFYSEDSFSMPQIFTAISYIGIYRVQILLLTHLLVSFYVAVDAIFASKLLYSTLLSYFAVSVLQMLYTGSRPFWDNSEVGSSTCVPSYAHPSIEAFLIFFLAATIYGFKKGGGLAALALCVLGCAVVFSKFVNGELYLTSIGLSLVYVLLFATGLRFSASFTDNLLKKSTVLPLDAKKYSFYWLMYLFLAQTVALIIYSSSEQFMDINWIQNFIDCLKDKSERPFDEVVGPWFTFAQTSVVFALIGAIFGIARCFRKMSSINWYEGSTRHKLLRLVIANAVLVPSWLFVLLAQGEQNPKQWVRDIGLNSFFIDSVHWFLLYLVEFGYLPTVVFIRLGLVREEQNQFFITGMKDKEEALLAGESVY